ncbi:MAG: DoxX family protein [Fuerstiella sp.]
MNNPYASSSEGGRSSASSVALSVGLLIMRLTFGGMMLVHGIPKLMGFSEKAGVFPDPLGIGSQLSLAGTIGAEVVCAGLLAAGLLTRVVAVPLAFTMAIALFVIHGADPWQKKELAAMYLCGYVGLLFTGPGAISIDHLWRNRKAKSKE